MSDKEIKSRVYELFEEYFKDVETNNDEVSQQTINFLKEKVVNDIEEIMPE